MAGHQVAELVGSAELYPAVVVLVQVVEIMGLKQLVAELGQTHALRALHPGLHAVSAQQRAHPEVPANVGQKRHDIPVSVPARVIQHGECPQSLVTTAVIELMVGEYSLHTLSDASRVILHDIVGHLFSLGGFPAGVPDLGRGSSQKSDYIVPGVSEVQEADDGEQIPNVQAVCGGVESTVHSLWSSLQQPRKLHLGGGIRESIFYNPSFVKRQQKTASNTARGVEVRPKAKAPRFILQYETSVSPCPTPSLCHRRRHFELRDPEVGVSF